MAVVMTEVRWGRGGVDRGITTRLVIASALGVSRTVLLCRD
jgi:hypothetical protein